MSIEKDMADVEVDELLDQITSDTIIKKVRIALNGARTLGKQPDKIIMGRKYYILLLLGNINYHVGILPYPFTKFLGFDIIEDIKPYTFDVYYKEEK